MGGALPAPLTVSKVIWILIVTVKYSKFQGWNLKLAVASSGDMKRLVK